MVDAKAIEKAFHEYVVKRNRELEEDCSYAERDGKLGDALTAMEKAHELLMCEHHLLGILIDEVAKGMAKGL